MNLLKNGGFETDWSDGGTHTAFVFDPDGNFVEDREAGNIFTPPHWYAFFKEGLPSGGFPHDPPNKEGWCQPEIRDAWKSHDAVRVAEGEKAILLFTFFRVHDAGFLQRIDAEPGQKLRLTARAHAWSNSKDGPHPDDPRWSEGPGYDAGYLLEGDTDDDAWRNFTFWLGLDPTGGSNPYASTVVWGRGAHIYNRHAQAPSVEVVAKSEYVTVFLRSRTLWRYKHNDSYWDDVALTEVESPARQYSRTYVLFSPRMSAHECCGVLQKHYGARHSLGWSADDAAVDAPEVRERHIVCYRPQDWPDGKQGLLDFWNRYYPGVDSIEWVDESQHPEILLCQCDQQWRDVRIPGCDKTLCKAGCLVTDVAMAQRYLGIDANATPLTVIEALGETGFYNCNLLWGMEHFRQKTGLQLRRSWNRDAVINWLSQPDHVAFAEVSPASYQHFVFVPRYDDERGDFWILDPWLCLEGWLRDHYTGVDSWRLVEKVAPSEPQYPKPAEFLSLHIQARSEGDEEYIAAVKPEWVKLVENMQWAREWIKPISPGTKVLYRHCVNNYDPYFNHSGGLRAGARLYLEQILDSLIAEAEWIDAVEGVNETIGTGDVDGIKRTVEFECHYADHLHAELGDAVAPCLLNPGVGNPQHGEETALLLPAAEKVVELNGYLGGHTYIGFRSADHYCTIPDEVRHFSMRPLLSWDVEFAKKGIFPRYLFTEGGGIYVAPNGSMPSAEAGWLYKDTCGGDWGWYKSKLLEYHQLVADWNAQHGNRCRGQCIFTFGGGEEWKAFRISREQLEDLARSLGTG